MKSYLMRLWKDEKGAETIEWIAIAAIIILVAVAVYGGGEGGALGTAMNTGLEAISSAMTGATTSGS